MMDFAEIEVFCDDTGTTATVVSYKGQNGVGLSFAPTVLRLGDGHVRITWSTTYTDEYGVEGTLDLKRPKPYGIGTAFLNVVATVTAANIIEVRCFDASGAAETDRSFVVEVSTMGDT
jgi:hypothetical protein